MTNTEAADTLEAMAEGACACAACQEDKEALTLAIRTLKREPLVQKVIAAWDAYLAALKVGSRGAVAEEALFDAVQTLKAWTP